MAMKTKWIISKKRADFKAIGNKYGFDQVIARIIRNRDIIEEEDIERFINGEMEDLYDPLLMKDMEKAVEILRQDINDGKRIRIIGDYDVDGVCATYILRKGLKVLGANVDTVIPHRILDGYGLNDSLIEKAHEDGIDTILTCDNGIAAHSQIDKANQYGMKVVVTDHHEVPYEMIGEVKRYILPKAAAVVDPKQEDCAYPCKNICGAVVAYKLIQALLEYKHPEVFEELIPFAAMATVCDVMELLDENRIIVKNGIKAMENPINIGLKALSISTGIADKKVTAYHFGFILGPTINATGRLDAAKRAIELFDSEDFNEACLIAVELKELNDARKTLTEEAAKEAIDIIENSDIKNDNVLVVFLPECHESVAGIVAGRIKEKYYKPSIVFTKAEDGVKGSGRSVEAYNMYEELTKVNYLFSKYGGHKMAAGMSLNNIDDIDVLRKNLNENCTLNEDDLCKKLKLDMDMPLSYISMPLIRSFDILEPCGVGNPSPLFADKDISLLSYEKKGKSRQIGKFRIMDAYNRVYDMIYFDDLNNFESFIMTNFSQEALNRLESGQCKKDEIVIKIAYIPDINVYNNRESMQIIMKYYDV